MAVIQEQYPNHVDYDSVIGVTTWVVLATDQTVYANLASLAAAGKKPWPQSYTGQHGIDYMSGLGPLTAQSDAGGTAGSAFYIEINQSTAPTSDNPASLVLGGGGSITYNAVGNLWNVWVRMTNASDKLRLYLAY